MDEANTELTFWTPQEEHAVLDSYLNLHLSHPLCSWMKHEQPKCEIDIIHENASSKLYNIIV